MSHRSERVRCLPPAQLVRFRQQDVDRAADRDTPVEHHAVEFAEAPAAVDDQHRADQRPAPLEVVLEQPSPLVANRSGDPRVPVTRQVDQAPTRLQAEEIDQLRAARALAGPGKVPAIHYRIDRAGFSRVGTTGEGDLDATVFDKLGRPAGAGQEAGGGVHRHG